jgi:hypothetical protein
MPVQGWPPAVRAVVRTERGIGYSIHNYSRFQQILCDSACGQGAALLEPKAHDDDGGQVHQAKSDAWEREKTRISWGIHGIPDVSLRPAMPYHCTLV